LKAKRAAEQDAKNTAGVWRVYNLLKVRAKDQLPNDKLAQIVKEALLRDPYLYRYQINVDAFKGSVYLAGTVDSSYDKTRAEDVASRVKGVTTVNNSLTVSYPAYTYYSWPYAEYYDEPYYYSPLGYSAWRYPSDADVKDSIESEFFWSPFVNRDDVHVAVNNGVATLTGTVNSWHRYRAAVDNAWEGGARDVINNLKVQ
jgi:osmotically-inducible protein OsmY